MRAVSVAAKIFSSTASDNSGTAFSGSAITGCNEHCNLHNREKMLQVPEENWFRWRTVDSLTMEG